MQIKNVTNFSSFLQILTREKIHDVLPFLFGVQWCTLFYIYVY